MNQLDSSDTRGALINPRTEKMFTRRDPLGYRRDFQYKFEIDLMDEIETESQIITRVGEHVLKEGSTFGDFYGFANSLLAAEEGAAKLSKQVEAASVDVVVITTAICTPVFIDPYEDPFLVGAARCFHVPYLWCLQDDPQRKMGWKKTFETWKNGAPGVEREAFEAFVTETRAIDVGEPFRKKKSAA